MSDKQTEQLSGDIREILLRTGRTEEHLKSIDRRLDVLNGTTKTNQGNIGKLWLAVVIIIASLIFAMPEIKGLIGLIF